MTLIPKQEHMPFTVNSIQYIVESARDIGNNLAKTNLGSGESTSGHFILIEFNATNPSSSPVTLNGTKAAVIDENGDTFWPVGSPDVSLIPPPGYQLFSKDKNQPTVINPGGTEELFVVVEVPLSTQVLSFAMTNLKDESYYVPLGR